MINKEVKSVEGKIRFLEKAIANKDKKIETLMRNIKILDALEDKKIVGVGSVLDKALKFDNKITEMHSKIIDMIELKAKYNLVVERYKSLIKSLLERLELSNKEDYDRAVEDFSEQIIELNNLGEV